MLMYILLGVFLTIGLLLIVVTNVLEAKIELLEQEVNKTRNVKKVIQSIFPITFDDAQINDEVTLQQTALVQTVKAQELIKGQKKSERKDLEKSAIFYLKKITEDKNKPITKESVDFYIQALGFCSIVLGLQFEKQEVPTAPTRGVLSAPPTKRGMNEGTFMNND